MRKLFSLFSAIVTFLWTAAETTTIPTGNRTLDGVLDKSALAPHVEVDEFDTPRILGLGDPAKFEDDHVQSNNEERGFQSLSTSLIASASSNLSKAQKLVSPRHNIDTVGARVEDEAIHEILMSKISHLQSLMDGSPTKTFDVAIRQLKKIGEIKQTVATLMRARGVDGMKEFADGSLGALIVRNKHSAKLVLTACVEARVSPDEVFLMLPIYGDILKPGFGARARRSKTFRDLQVWLKCVDEMNIAQSGGPFIRDGNIGYIHHRFPKEPFLIDIMMKKGNPKDVVAFVEYLRGKKPHYLTVWRMRHLLLVDYLDQTEALTLSMWAHAGMKPQDAIILMPWVDVSREFFAPIDPILEIDICKRLGQVLRYVNIYRRRRTFDDNAVDKLLLHFSTPEELRAYLMLLQDHRDVDEGVTELVEALLDLYQPNARDMARTSVILSNLLGGHTPWSTATVNRLHALPNALV